MRRYLAKGIYFFTVIVFLFLIFLAFEGNGFPQTKKEIKKWKKCEANIAKASNPEEMIEIYKKFIQKYPKNFYVQLAKEKIMELKFNEVKSINTIEAYKKFIGSYPNSKYAKKAKENVEKIEFDNVILKNTFRDYKIFIKEHPKSKYSEKASERIEDIKLQIRDKTKIIRSKFDVKTSSLLGKWSFNPKESITESIKKAGFEVVTGENQKYDIMVEVVYKESGGWKFEMKKGVSEMWYSIPDIEYKITLIHDSYGKLVLKEQKFRSGGGLYKKEEFKKDGKILSYWKSNLSNFKKDLSFKYFAEFLLSELGDEKPLARALEEDK